MNNDRIDVLIDEVDMIKLTRAAGRIGKTPEQAASIIATEGVDFFLSLLVGATE